MGDSDSFDDDDVRFIVLPWQCGGVRKFHCFVLLANQRLNLRRFCKVVSSRIPRCDSACRFARLRFIRAKRTSPARPDLSEVGLERPPCCYADQRCDATAHRIAGLRQGMARAPRQISFRGLFAKAITLAIGSTPRGKRTWCAHCCLHGLILPSWFETAWKLRCAWRRLKFKIQPYAGTIALKVSQGIVTGWPFSTAKEVPAQIALLRVPCHCPIVDSRFDSALTPSRKARQVCGRQWEKCVMRKLRHVHQATSWTGGWNTRLPWLKLLQLSWFRQLIVLVQIWSMDWRIVMTTAISPTKFPLIIFVSNPKAVFTVAQTQNSTSFNPWRVSQTSMYTIWDFSSDSVCLIFNFNPHNLFGFL